MPTLPLPNRTKTTPGLTVRERKDSARREKAHSALRKSRTRCSTSGTAAVEVATAGAAVAVADNVRAPYAEASATVNSSGGIQNSKGVEKDTCLGTGEWVRHLHRPRFDPSQVLPSVSSLQWRQSISYGWSSGCDASTHSVRVFSYDMNGPGVAPRFPRGALNMLTCQGTAAAPGHPLPAAGRFAAAPTKGYASMQSAITSSVDSTQGQRRSG